MCVGALSGIFSNLNFLKWFSYDGTHRERENECSICAENLRAHAHTHTRTQFNGFGFVRFDASQTPAQSFAHNGSWPNINTTGNENSVFFLVLFLFCYLAAKRQLCFRFTRCFSLHTLNHQQIFHQIEWNRQRKMQKEYCCAQKEEKKETNQNKSCTQTTMCLHIWMFVICDK